VDAIDSILNVVCLLLWLSWRSSRFDPLVRTSVSSLAGTLRRAEPSRVRRWQFLVVLGLLLVARAIGYWQIGSAVDWTPKLALGAISVSFRSDYLSRMLLFSALGFAVTLAFFYIWLLLLSFVNGAGGGTEVFQKFVRIQLGRLDGWPRIAKVLLPLVVISAVWLALHPLLTSLRIIPAASSAMHRVEQAATVGLGAYLSLKYLIAGVLCLYVVNSYLFLGKHPLWDYVSLTGQNLLVPLRYLPLRIGKLDLAPLFGIAVVLVAGHWAESGLTALYRQLPI
jgi:hypothetical protein